MPTHDAQSVAVNMQHINISCSFTAMGTLGTLTGHGGMKNPVQREIDR
jgi:hypothetical protein